MGQKNKSAKVRIERPFNELGPIAIEVEADGESDQYLSRVVEKVCHEAVGLLVKNLNIKTLEQEESPDK